SGLANALVSRGGFDSVWGFDDIAYHGRVNEARALNIADIPMGFDGALKALISTIGAKALQVVNLPAYIVEGAARNLFLNLDFLGQTEVTIIGHSLGGVVTRCMVESYDVAPFVRSVVTLASPHYLWLLAQRSNLQYWKGIPSPDIRYLAVLGKADWVSREMYSNYTADDRPYGNLTKVLIKGDHTSIHGQPFGTYVPELIKGFLDEFQGFYIQVQGGKPYLRYVPLHGNSGEQVVSFPQGRWLEFTASSS
ncbi:alpha/beta fold hydrolase, partial [Accumulibacter sp.]|uniref:alpha/beta fold hydrolase n=1 Tax=Accumulibacter sp. TaxID=2053492 RepID=UPI002B92AE60